jgi:hypothetical protein
LNSATGWLKAANAFPGDYDAYGSLSYLVEALSADDCRRLAPISPAAVSAWLTVVARLRDLSAPGTDAVTGADGDAARDQRTRGGAWPSWRAGPIG